jgi:flagellar hook-length control protein FliK
VVTSVPAQESAPHQLIVDGTTSKAPVPTTPAELTSIANATMPALSVPQQQNENKSGKALQAAHIVTPSKNNIAIDATKNEGNNTHDSRRDIVPQPRMFQPALTQNHAANADSPVATTLQQPAPPHQAPSYFMDMPITHRTTVAQAPLYTLSHDAVTTKLAETLGVEIVRQVGEQNKQFSIRLDPPELGRIDIKLDMQNDLSVKATLVVDNEKTLETLQRDSRVLERALNDAGLKTDSNSLNFSLKQQGDQQTLWQQQNHKIDDADLNHDPTAHVTANNDRTHIYITPSRPMNIII